MWLSLGLGDENTVKVPGSTQMQNVLRRQVSLHGWHCCEGSNQHFVEEHPVLDVAVAHSPMFPAVQQRHWHVAEDVQVTTDHFCAGLLPSTWTATFAVMHKHSAFCIPIVYLQEPQQTFHARGH